MFSSVVIYFSVFTSLTWACNRTEHSGCSVRTEWGSNACSIGGTLYVRSTRGVEISRDRCNFQVNKFNFTQQPLVRYSSASVGETYTLVMMDADAANHTEGRYYLHWLVANIPGEDFVQGDLDNGRTIASYVAPAPPRGSGLHRFMFAVFRHNNSAATITDEIRSNQLNQWSLAGWLEREASMGVRLCGPQSGVQFTADYGTE